MRMQSLATIGCFLLVVGALPAAGGAAVYFVAVDGDDGQVGSDSQPWQSLGYAATRVAPGDLVVVRPGTYQEAVVLTHSGEADAAIVFRGLPGASLTSPDARQSLSAFDIAAGVSYVELQGFDLGGGFDETVFVRSAAQHIVLRGLHVHDNHTGIWIGGASDVVVRDTVVEHNYRTGIRIFAGAHGIQVVDTRSVANADGLGCNGDSDGLNADDSTSDIHIERVSVVGNSEDGFDLQTPSVTLLQAITRDNGCSGIKMAAGGFLENVLAEGNRTGVNVDGTPGMTTVLHNCTLSQNDLGVRAMGDGTTIVLHNSVVTGAAKALSYAAPVNVLEDHNIFYRPRLDERLIVRVEANGDETLFSGDDINSGRWQLESGQGEATLADDPRFDAAGCVPGPGSPAVDSGDAATSAPVDLVGTSRPVGNGVDRGAIERVPDASTLRVRRVAFRPDETGMGPLRLDASMNLPAAPSFDPLHDALNVSVRGSRGQAVAVTVPPAAWASFSSRTRASYRTDFDDMDQGRHVRARLDGQQLRLSVTAARADLWTIDGTAVNVTVECGRLRANADIGLRTARRTIPTS